MHFLTLGFCTRTHRATDETTVAYKSLTDLIAQKRKSEYGITLAWMAQLVEHRDIMRKFDFGRTNTQGLKITR